MAFEDDVLDISLLTTTDLSSYQYHFVELSANNTVVICSNATTSNPIGVLQNKPTAAQGVARVRVMGVSRVMAGDAITYGQLVGTDANGEGIAKTANTAKFVGVALDTAAAGELVTVMIQCGLRTISV